MALPSVCASRDVASLWLLLLPLLLLAVLPSCSTCRVVAASDDDATSNIITPSKRPDWRDKAATARWMVHAIDYGVLSTLSSRRIVDAADIVVPFGNVYSFVDGPRSNGTGTPYFYGTYLDQSFKDMRQNPWASLALTEASLLWSSTSSGKIDNDDDKALRDACSVAGSLSPPPQSFTSSMLEGDPENPVCARLTLTGKLEEVPRGSNEFMTVQAAFFERHPQMKEWPVDHNWVIAKLVLRDIWLVDYYGGATVIDPETYYGSSISGTMDSRSSQHRPKESESLL